MFGPFFFIKKKEVISWSAHYLKSKFLFYFNLQLLDSNFVYSMHKKKREKNCFKKNTLKESTMAAWHCYMCIHLSQAILLVLVTLGSDISNRYISMCDHAHQI